MCVRPLHREGATSRFRLVCAVSAGAGLGALMLEGASAMSVAIYGAKMIALAAWLATVTYRSHSVDPVDPRPVGPQRVSAAKGEGT